jgi:alkylation response protein AidB-like acyl-CoA dehydrogenase
VAVESAAAVAEAAWDFPEPFTATMAKATAGQNARTVGRHVQQVLAGMGFTTEHAFHRYLRRTRVLDQLFGSTAVLLREVGEQALRDRALPAMLPL